MLSPALSLEMSKTTVVGLTDDAPPAGPLPPSDRTPLPPVPWLAPEAAVLPPESPPVDVETSIFEPQLSKTAERKIKKGSVGEVRVLMCRPV